MKSESPEGRREKESNGIFDVFIDEERRFFYFAGSKEDIIDFMGRIDAASIVHDPDRERYQKRLESFRQSEEAAVERWLQDPLKKGDPYAFTPVPFRLYIYAEQHKNHLSKQKVEQLNALRSDRWVVKMLENNNPQTDEEKQKAWEEIKENFERIRQEMIQERHHKS